MGDKCDAIRFVYGKLTTRDIQFEFKADLQFNTFKK